MTMVSRQPLPSRPRRQSSEEIKLELGEKIEAQDSFQNWYPARIVEVDEKDKTVLIHFEGWNQRHDEWLPYTSNRLRGTSIEIERRRQGRKKNFENGAQVEVKYKNYGYYPAIVIEKKEHDSYHIRYEDNVEVTVSSSCVRERKISSQSYQRTEKERQEKLAEERRRRALKRNSSGDAKTTGSPSARRRRLSSTSDEKDHPARRRRSGPTPIVDSDSDYSEEEDDEEEEEEDDDDDDEASVFNAESPPHSPSPQKTKTALPSSNSEENRDRGVETENKSLSSQSSVPSVVPMMNDSSVNEKAAASKSVSPSSLPPLPPPPRPVGRPPKRSGAASHGKAKKTNRVETRRKTSKPSGIGASREFVVMEDHNLFKCYHLGCDKSFRKSGRLDAHVKYYHHEMDAPRKKHKMMMAKQRQIAAAAAAATAAAATQPEVGTIDAVDGSSNSQSAPATTGASKENAPAFKGRKIGSPKVPRTTEDLKPSHIVAWKKLRLAYKWHEFGMLPKASPDAVIPPAGVDVEAAKAAITACRHAILADLLAVERMMHSLDSRVDVAENPNEERLKAWMPQKKLRRQSGSKSKLTTVEEVEVCEDEKERIQTNSETEDSQTLSVVPYELSDEDNEAKRDPIGCKSPSSSSTSSGTLYDDGSTIDDEEVDDDDSISATGVIFSAQMRLFNEVDKVQDQLEARMDFLEEQLKILEDDESVLIASASAIPDSQ